MADPRSEVNDSLVSKRLSRAKKLIQSGADTLFGDKWVDIETGENRCLTFYFDEV